MPLMVVPITPRAIMTTARNRMNGNMTLAYPATVEDMLLVLLAVLVVLLIVLPLIGLALWTLISIGVVGLIIGGLARLVIPGRQDIGILATILIGWIGSLVGGFLGFHVLHTGRFLTILLEIGVAAALVAIAGGTRNSWSNRNTLSRW